MSCGPLTGWCLRCARCRLAMYSPAHRANWAALGPVPDPLPRPKPPRRAAAFAAPVPLPVLPPCPHEGAVREFCTGCGGEGRHVRDCAHPANPTETCTRERVGPAVWACATCEHHPARAVGAYAPKPGDPAVGVVVGSYWWPELAELQVRLIRRTCGDIPVLISADPTPHRLEYVDQIERVAKRTGARLWLDERRGHTAGDAAAYWRGVEYAAAMGLDYVVKLSQRLLFTSSRWAQDAAVALRDSGLPIATRRCAGRQRYPLRTEFAVLDVAAWSRPGPLAALKGIEHGGGPAGLPMEFGLRGLLDGLGWRYLPYAPLPEVREEPAPGVVWRHANPRADYDRVAAARGVALPADFNVDGWGKHQAAGLYDAG